jgi:hypothetical protein
MDSAKNMKKKSMAKILCGHYREFPKKNLAHVGICKSKNGTSKASSTSGKC